jgi:anaerobic magnesium-protoporphyrin IX monomethyl ester cyclase
MKVALIQPVGRTVYEISPEPPLGLAYLAAALLEYKNDLDIEIIDGLLLDYDDYYEKISTIDADVIGVTSTITLLNEALRIPSLVGKMDAKFIIGGPGSANLASFELYDSGYSVICYGEGERTIVELMKAFEHGLPLDDVNGIAFLHNNHEIKTRPREPIENLDDIPFPARDLLDMKKYLSIWKEKMGVAITQMVSSRGCPFSCRFCSKNVFGRKARFMSHTRVIEEMRLIYDKYKVDKILFDDDLFTLDRKRVLNFCDAMEKELPGKRWCAQARVEMVDLEMLTRMKDAGCTNLMFGVESGSQRILDFLGKGITVEQIKKAFQWVNKVGIAGGMFLIVGVPGETQQDIDMTKELIRELKPKSIDLCFLTPIPGTEIFEMTKHMIRDDADFYSFNESCESVYRKEAFEVEPQERIREIMGFFLDTFKDKCKDSDRTFFYSYDLEGLAT